MIDTKDWVEVYLNKGAYLHAVATANPCLFVFNHHMISYLSTLVSLHIFQHAAWVGPTPQFKNHWSKLRVTMNSTDSFATLTRWLHDKVLIPVMRSCVQMPRMNAWQGWKGKKDVLRV